MVWPWYWPEGSHNSPRQKAEGHYGCPKRQLASKLNLDYKVNQAIMGLNMDLLGHYGLCFTSHIASSIVLHGHKGQ